MKFAPWHNDIVKEGFVIFDTAHEVYLYVDKSMDILGRYDLAWDANKFTIIRGKDIESIEELIFDGGIILKGMSMDSIFFLFQVIKDSIGDMIVIPCMRYSGQCEKIKFDYLHAFKFVEAPA